MQSLAEWKFGSCNVGDKKKTAGKPRTASAYGRAVKKSRHSQVVIGGVQSNPEYRQSKLRYPLGFTVIGCLHKQKDPIKPKDLIYCSIYLAPIFRFYSVLTFLKRM